MTSRPTIKSLKSELEQAIAKAETLTAKLEDSKILNMVLQGEYQSEINQKIEAKKQLIRLQMELQSMKSRSE